MEQGDLSDHQRKTHKAEQGGDVRARVKSSGVRALQPKQKGTK